MTMTLKRAALAAIASLSLTALPACSGEADAPADMTTQEEGGKTVASVIGERDNLSMLAAKLGESGLSGMLDGQASYTILAPTDEAFEALGDAEALSGEGSGAIVAALLRDHLLPGALTPEAIEQAIAENEGAVSLKTLGGASVSFSLEGGELSVAGAEGPGSGLASGAVVANNGVVMPIDGFVAQLPQPAE